MNLSDFFHYVFILFLLFYVIVHTTIHKRIVGTAATTTSPCHTRANILEVVQKSFDRDWMISRKLFKIRRANVVRKHQVKTISLNISDFSGQCKVD